MNTFSPLLRAAFPTLLLSLSAACASAAPVQVDPAALALLQKVQAATQKTHSLTADFTEIFDSQSPPRELRDVGVVKLMKPNYVFGQQWDPRKNKATGKWEKPAMSLISDSDGKTIWTLFSSGEYRKDKADPHGRNFGSFTPAFDFFGLSQSVLAQVRRQQAKGQLVGVTCAGKEIWEGRSYQLIDWEYKPDAADFGDAAKKAPGGVVIEKDKLFIGSDNLVYRVEDAYNVGWSGSRSLRNVKINAPLTTASFKFTLPPSAVAAKSTAIAAPPAGTPLLAARTPAPDFAATAPDGSLVHLSDYKGKTVVLDFWSTWCGPCQMSMPHLEKVYQAVKGQNVAVLGVCVWDEKPAYDKWVTAKKDTYHFPTAFDPAGRGKKSIASDLYHVSGIPTQYVIDKDGKIAASTVGYDEKGTDLEDALKRQGVVMPEAKTAAAKP